MAILVDSPPENNNWVHEIKYDGYRIQVHIKQNRIIFLTRNGHDWSDKFVNLFKEFKKFPIKNAIFDGEIVVLDALGKSDFAKLQETISTNNHGNLKIFIFDLLYLDGKNLCRYPLRTRKDKLKEILPQKNSFISYSEDIDQSGSVFFKLACKHKLEGIISKDSKAAYISGKSGNWYKVKCSKSQEFVIGGFTEGTGNRKNELGALLLGVYESHEGKNKLRYVGKVGTGFDFKKLKEIQKKALKLTQKKSPFDFKSPREVGIHWLSPTLVAEIKFSNWTPDNILRNPRFVALKVEPSEEDQTITHPEKILFPSEKISKKNILDYYQKISSYMIPLIKDRPLSVLRCPKGATEKCFYQKHLGAGDSSKYFHIFKVREKSKREKYFSINSVRGLIQLVQMNAFEIHNWNSHYQTLLKPDQIVIDFDPSPELPFKKVVNACFELKKILDKLKLKSFVKVTGGKGVHVHIPIVPIYDQYIVKAFAKAIVDKMVEQNPELYLASISKKLRTGKIYIDYLRNSFGATEVAPYSIRAKEVSAVALPIEWSELPKVKSPDQFTIKKALQKIAKRKSDPWENILATEQKITMLD